MPNPTPSVVSDEAVEAACLAFYADTLHYGPEDKQGGRGWADMGTDFQDAYRPYMRAALTAALPLLLSEREEWYEAGKWAQGRRVEARNARLLAAARRVMGVKSVRAQATAIMGLYHAIKAIDDATLDASSPPTEEVK